MVIFMECSSSRLSTASAATLRLGLNCQPALKPPVYLAYRPPLLGPGSSGATMRPISAVRESLPLARSKETPRIPCPSSESGVRDGEISPTLRFPHGA